MDSSGPSSPFASSSFNTGIFSHGPPPEFNGMNGSDRLHELESGIDQFVRISRWAILQLAMDALGAPAPEFSVVDVDHCCFKVSIKLSLFSLTTINGEVINHSVIEGEISSNYNNAQDSAILKALNLLENNYKIKVFDFSSSVRTVLQNCHTQDLLVQGIGSLQNLLVQWDLLFLKYKNTTDEMQKNKWIDHFGGPLTPNGIVYSVGSDYLQSIQSDMHEKASELRSDFDDIKSDWLNLQDKMQKNADPAPDVGPEVILSSKFLLELVLSFFGIGNAEYISFPDPLGTVKCEAIFVFPQLKNFKYGGKLAIAGYGYSSVDGEQEAAYQSLLFIQKHFRIHVLDYNYSKCKKTRKSHNKILSMLQSILEIGVSVRVMIGELINSIKVQLDQFTDDSSTVFAGPMCAGQVLAYEFCSKVLRDLDEHSSQCIGSCEPDFVALRDLTWKLIEAKTNLPI